MIRSFAILLLAMPFVLDNAAAHDATPVEPSTATPTSAKPQVMWIDDESEESSIRKGMGLDGYDVTYKDADGTPINFQQFSAGLAAQRSISITKNTNEKVAVLELGPEGEALAEPTSPAYTVKIGAALPAFVLHDLNGKPIETAARRGRPTLLSFYFSECVPCIREIPMLNAFAESKPDIELFAITFDDVANARTFATKYAFAWPILADAQAFIDAIGISTYPTFILVDAEGKLRAIERMSEQLSDAAQLALWVDASLSAAAKP